MNADQDDLIINKAIPFIGTKHSVLVSYLINGIALNICSVTIKINPLLIAGILIGIIFLIFGIVRSNNNAQKAIKKSIILDSLNDKLVEENKIALKREEEYEFQIHFIDGQMALIYNQLSMKDDTLKAANNRISSLIKRRTPMTPSVDTSITAVPNEYINDCEECFTELSKGRDLFGRYKKSNDSLVGNYLKRKTISDKRISELTKDNNTLRLSLSNTISLAAERNKSASNRKILISLSTLLINANLPNAIGGGLAYQDRYNRIYSIKYFGSKYGDVKQADIFIPISFRKNR